MHSGDCCGHSTRRGFLGGAVAATGGAAGFPGVSRAAADGVAARRPARLQAFDMADVTLMDGPFLHAQRMTEAYLLSLKADRLLHNFRVNAGLAPKAPVYGGWESDADKADIHCQGQTLGHYLSACALGWRATGDARYRQRIDYVADELAACQAASGSGLVCAFPDGAALVAAHLRGDRITGVPWYTLHKVYAGLRDAVLLADSARARDVLMKMADWGVVATRPLSDAQFETMLLTEYGGMNEVYADLFAMTGNADYRTLAERFSQKAVLAPLARRHDQLDGMHANTQIPKVIGFQRVYEMTGEPKYRDASDFFWRTVAQTRSYATGGHGDGEHFFAVADFDRHVFSAKGSETCGQYNMLKLTRALFLHDPQADYADYYERVLYNGILASQDPGSGMTTYFQGTKPGYMKLYHTPEHSFWCCTGTGLENHLKYRDSIYFHDGDTLWVNLFIPSAVKWRAKDATLTQTTRFPEAPVTSFRWASRRPVDATVKLRHPRWSRSAVVLVDGVEVARSTRPGSYVDVRRTWRDGDRVELRLEMAVAAEAAPAAPDIVALTYGPIVLSGIFGNAGIAPGADFVVNERKYGVYNDRPFTVPTLAGDPARVAGTVRRGAAPLEFDVTAADGTAIRLIPYYRVAHERYVTYWPVTRA